MATPQPKANRCRAIFFNVHGSAPEIDPEGVPFDDDDAARLEAIRLTGTLLPEYANYIVSGESWHLDVSDETE